jgi:2,3-bisphosphoglycerate-dependent phosphoglycerate mutase
MTTSIYFVRHAVSPFRIGHDRFRPLSAEGLQASRKVAELLAHEGIDAVISSPYTRAVETVSLLAEQVKLPVVTVEALRGAVGTHGNVMTAIFNYYDDRYGFDFWQRTTMPDVYRVDFDGERWLHMERLWQEGPHAN